MGITPNTNMRANLLRNQGGRLKHAAVYGLHDWLPLLKNPAESVQADMNKMHVRASEWKNKR